MKTQNIIVTVLVTAFLALNTYLLFAEKSVIPKAQYISQYERLAADDYTKELDKEGFISPKELHTIYLKDDETIESWLVEEGETVDFGTELASLKVDKVDSERNELDAELTALQDQASSISQTISALQSAQSSANSSSNDSDYYDSNDENKVRVNLNVGIEVTDDSSYSHAIADAERDLAEVQKKTAIVEAKLTELPNESALTSPVSGYVVAIKRDNDSPSIDIYSTDQTIVTYVLDGEWPKVETGAPVTIQHSSIRTPFTPNVNIDQQTEETDVIEDGSGSNDDKTVAALSADGGVPYEDPKTEIDGTDAEPPAVNPNGGSTTPPALDPNTNPNTNSLNENLDGSSGNPDGSADTPNTPDSSLDSTNDTNDNKPNTTPSTPPSGTTPGTDTPPATDSTPNPDEPVESPAESDGTTTNPDGTVTFPDGSTSNPDGTITNPDGTITNPEVEQSPEGNENLTNDQKKVSEAKHRITPDYPDNISTINGVVVSVSKVPAKEDDWLKAYKSLGNTQKGNPLAYYEVRVAPYDEQMDLPFGTNVNTFIQTDEANQAVSVKTNWLIDKYEHDAKVWTLDTEGRAVQHVVEAPFTSLDRSVLTAGVEPGMVALHNEDMDSNLENQSVFHPLPMYVPEWKQWKNTSWQNYVRYLIKR